jgi:hypothetical protein
MTPQPPAPDPDRDRSTLGFESCRPYVDPVIEAYKKDVDRTLIREMLKLSPEERILRLQRALEDLFALRRAMDTAVERGER